MSHYQFSNPVKLGVLPPGLGPSVGQQEWPRKMPLKYRYSGLGDRKLGKEYLYTGLGALGTAPEATQGIQQLLTHLSAHGSAFQTALGQASGYINLVLSAASLGTGIASAACSGCDRTGIDITNNIIGWIRALLNGQSPTIAGLTQAQLNGFVDFCRIKDGIKVGLDAAFSIAAIAAARDSGASRALVTVQGFLSNFLDAICQIPAIQAAMAPAAPAMQTCTDGSVIPADQTCPTAPRFQYRPSTFHTTMPFRIISADTGGGGGAAPSSGISGGMVVGILAVLGIGAYAYSQRGSALGGFPPHWAEKNGDWEFWVSTDGSSGFLLHIANQRGENHPDDMKHFSSKSAAIAWARAQNWRRR